MKNAEIEKITNFSKVYISKLISMFPKNGFAPLLTDECGGNHREINLKKEQEFPNEHKEKAS